MTRWYGGRKDSNPHLMDMQRDMHRLGAKPIRHSRRQVPSEAQPRPPITPLWVHTENAAREFSEGLAQLAGYPEQPQRTPDTNPKTGRPVLRLPAKSKV